MVCVIGRRLLQNSGFWRWFFPRALGFSPERMAGQTACPEDFPGAREKNLRGGKKSGSDWEVKAHRLKPVLLERARG